jgi:two-component system, LuxR family, response regulator FixJ
MSGDGTVNGGMVFIVDDDAAVRDSLTVLLEAYGLEVRAYDSAVSFRGDFRAAGPACLVLDQHMPVMTGLEFLNSVEGRSLDIPVILITAYNDKTIRAQAEKAGVFAFLAKPVAAPELMSAIAEAVSQAAASRPQARKGNCHG